MDPTGKRCVTCHTFQPLPQFNKRAHAPDGLQPRCRSCARDWYVANREQHMANVRDRNIRVRDENKALLESYLLEHPCVDCGEPDLRVLDLDHDDPTDKTTEVGRLIASGMSWERVAAEIGKCTVRCANCHRRRTAAQLGYWRDAAEARRRAAAVVGARTRLTALLGVG